MFSSRTFAILTSVSITVMMFAPSAFAGRTTSSGGGYSSPSSSRSSYRSSPSYSSSRSTSPVPSGGGSYRSQPQTAPTMRPSVQAPRPAAAPAPTYPRTAPAMRPPSPVQAPANQHAARPAAPFARQNPPLAPGQSRTYANGATVTKHADGVGQTVRYTDQKTGNQVSRVMTRAKDGSQISETIARDQSGRQTTQTLRKNVDGSIQFKASNGSGWSRSPDGLKTVTNNGRTVYSESRGSYRGQTSIIRNYGNNSNVTVINRNYYGGSHYVFVPSFSYGFGYGYFYHPFATPFAYGWGPQPYYGYYSWWAPSPFYPSLSFWLVDYLMIQSMQQAHDQQVAANAVAQVQAQQQQAQQLSQAQQDAIRQAVAEQVQVAVQSVQTQTPMTPDQYMKPGRVFVVNTGLSAQDQQGNACDFQQGDILKLQQPPSDQNPLAMMNVMTSKDPACRAGSVVQVSADDLIEMQNSLAGQVQSGMQKMQNDPKIPKQ